MAFDGLEIDNNFRWTIINALSTVNAIDQAGIDAELAKRETTENREFAYGARAVAGTAEAKAWAWNEALHNDELTNMQLEAVAGGFAATPRADLAEPYAEKYFEVADWIWEHKTFHMAEALLEGLYPAMPIRRSSWSWVTPGSPPIRTRTTPCSALCVATSRLLTAR